MLNKKIKHLKRDFNQWSFLIMIIGFVVTLPIFSILIHLLDGTGEMWDHIVSYFLLDYIQNSLFLLVGTGVLCSAFGISTAWLIANYSFSGRRILQWLLFLPLAIPSYIVAYAYVGLLGNGGVFIRFLQSIGFDIQKIEMMNIYGLIWVLSCSLFPYVYTGTIAMFKSQPKSIRETCQLLGISELRYFFSVALPLASPAIIGGLFLVFMEVLNDYGAAKYYGIMTFTTGIFRTWTALEDLQSAIYLSALLILMLFGFKSLLNWLQRNKSYVIKTKTDEQSNNDLKKLSGWKNILCILVVSIPVLFGFILPLIQLLYWVSFSLSTSFNYDLLLVALESFGIAFSTAFLAILTAILLIFVSRWNAVQALRPLKKLATIGYVIPGAIIGIGIIRSNQSIINFFDSNLNLQIGYLFYGSSAVLIYAYVFKFLAVAFNPIEANNLKLGKYLYESSYLLGIGKIKTLLKVEFPLLSTILTSTFILLFIDVLKELPLTLILKPYKVQTLAVQAYAYAEDERIELAAAPALVLIAVIVSLMLLLNLIKKRVDRSKAYRS